VNSRIGISRKPIIEYTWVWERGVFMRLLCITFLLCFSKILADDGNSLEDFFGKRFSLYPPTEEQSRAVIKQVRSFLNHINTNDLSEAYFQDTNSEFRATTSFDNFNIFAQKFRGLDLKQRLDVHAVNFDNDDKTLATDLIIYQGKQKFQKSYIEFSLKYEDDTWGISGIKIYETFKTGR
jgi:hypothetical protein